jgi:hypothetical protein
MGNLILQCSLGHATVDTTLQEVIRLFENAFPGQIAGYYVEGSYADQTYLATSDIDIIIVFSNHFAHEEVRKTAERLWVTSAHASTMEVDITIVDEDDLHEGVYPTLKVGSQLIYGQDVCSKYPILSLEAWTRERMHAAYCLLVTVYQRSTPVYLPLVFPNPEDEFYGYANRMVRLPDGKEVPCTRNLVRTTGWAATALLALQAKKYVVRKRDCPGLYRHFIGDEWSSLLKEVSTICRDEWQYLIPVERRDRQRLRALCERTLHFEQHYLSIYKPYLLEQLHSTEQEYACLAVWFQEQFPLDDEEIMSVLQSVV